jgi:hypothetical protein
VLTGSPYVNWRIERGPSLWLEAALFAPGAGEPPEGTSSYSLGRRVRPMPFIYYQTSKDYADSSRQWEAAEDEILGRIERLVNTCTPLIQVARLTRSPQEYDRGIDVRGFGFCRVIVWEFPLAPSDGDTL